MNNFRRAFDSPATKEVPPFQKQPTSMFKLKPKPTLLLNSASKSSPDEKNLKNTTPPQCKSPVQQSKPG